MTDDEFAEKLQQEINKIKKQHLSIEMSKEEYDTVLEWQEAVKKNENEKEAEFKNLLYIEKADIMNEETMITFQVLHQAIMLQPYIIKIETDYKIDLSYMKTLNVKVGNRVNKQYNLKDLVVIWINPKRLLIGKDLD